LFLIPWKVTYRRLLSSKSLMMYGSGKKILFLRVGIDLGCGGTLGPIFQDGTFEYVPIPENPNKATKRSRYFLDLPARHGGTLERFVSPQYRNQPAHYDPEFETFTYGDPTKNKRRQILKLNTGDMLVFYAGLRPIEERYGGKLYIIGYFTVINVEEIPATYPWPPEGFEHLSCNAHLRRAEPDIGLVIIQGDPLQSRLLDKAILLSDESQYILPGMSDLLGMRGSLKRSIGRWVTMENVERVSDWLNNMPSAFLKYADEDK
jgi:hypothetical protein